MASAIKVTPLSKESLINNFDTNYSKYKRHIEMCPLIFMDMKFSISEIVKCLVVEANTAAITLTNHAFERLLKLALVEDDLQLGPTTHPWSDCWECMHKYMGLDMQQTIGACARNQLISGKRKKQLLKYKEILRNGFSHAQPEKMLKDIPDTINVKMAKDFDVPVNIKKDVRFQFPYLLKLSNDKAQVYFHDFIETLIEIEDNLQLKYPGMPKLIPVRGGGLLRHMYKGWQKKPNPYYEIIVTDYQSIKFLEAMAKQFKATIEKQDIETIGEIIYRLIFENIKDANEFAKAMRLAGFDLEDF